MLVSLLGVSVYHKQKAIETEPNSILIIDQLHRENKDFNFTYKCTTLFEENGYNVNTIRGENVTINKLKTINWKKDIIIFRTHSGVFDGNVWIFTGEEYTNQQYVLEQLNGLINIGKCPSYDYNVNTFSSGFITRFIDTNSDCIVILMGCDGMNEDEFVESFHRVGCKTIIGWGGPVSLTNTDELFYSLLESYCSGYDIEFSFNLVKENNPLTSNGFKISSR